MLDAGEIGFSVSSLFCKVHFGTWNLKISWRFGWDDIWSGVCWAFCKDQIMDLGSTPAGGGGLHVGAKATRGCKLCAQSVYEDCLQMWDKRA